MSAGISILACALFLGQRDLTRLAVVVLALPLVSLLLTLGSRARLTVSRTVSEQLGVTESANVHLVVGNDGRQLDSLLIADHLPEAIGTAARFSVASLPTGQTRTVTYTITPHNRGQYELGPLRVSITEPLGLATLTRSVGRTTDLVVHPAVVPLENHLEGSTGDLGSTVSSQVAETGIQAMAVREYRHGDDLRRVHWRSTARRGELMVRADEHSTAQHATVLLDNRFAAHDRAQGGTAGFELAVSLTASICEDLRLRGFLVALVTLDTGGLPDARHEGQLEALATVTLVGQAPPLVQLVTAAPEQQGPLVAIMGSLDSADAASLRDLDGSRKVLFHRPPTADLGLDGWLTRTLMPGLTVAQAWANTAEVRV